jgi:quinoprotein glucose dehydrogenase
VRMRFQREVVRRGAGQIPALTALAQEQESLHAIWALQQLSAAAELRGLLTHVKPEIRAQAARALGALGDREAIERLRGLLADAEPRPRLFATLALARLRAIEVSSDVVTMIEAQGATDPFQRHVGVVALSRLMAEPELAGYARHKDGGLRLSALLALRRLQSSQVAVFLRDRDPGIAAEAVRAINDLAIKDAIPALAREARRFYGQPCPVQFQSEFMFRRLLRALQVTATPDSVLDLVQLASHGGLSDEFRRLALKTLSLIIKPPPVDPTVGMFRPLEPRDSVPIRKAATAGLHQLLITGPSTLRADVLATQAALGIDEPLETLVAWAAEAAQPMAFRLAALRRLGVRAKVLLAESHPLLQTTAARTLIAAKPQEEADTVRALLTAGHEDALRTAYDVLTSSKLPDAVPWLIAEADQMMAGRLAPGVHLDLMEALAVRREPAAVAQNEKVTAWLAGQKMTKLDLALSGGDPVQGRNVFTNQGTCLKCHRVGPIGGTAGPKLDKLTQRLTPAQILQSVVEPNAVVVDGFGIATVTLADGKTVVGTPMEETATTLRMRNPAGAVETLAKAKIKERTPPVSPMPPLGQVLSKRDLRDLLAYLQTLN